MKRHAWPNRIVEVPSRRPDPRSDPQATRKITREQLDDALRKTKSGTRPVARPERVTPEPPHDTGPEIEIPRIESVELPVFDPASGAARVPAASEASGFASIGPSNIPASRGLRVHVTPRLVLLVGLGAATIVLLAVLVGFLAGRIGR